jgi:hypothetical protein
MRSLHKFSLDETFCSDNHFKVFNQNSLAFTGKRYLPALSFRELLDDSIIGSGLRPMSDKLEKMVEH